MGDATVRHLKVCQVFLFVCFVVAPLCSQSGAGQVQLYPQVKHKKSIPLRDISPKPMPAASSDPDEDADAAPRMHRRTKQTVRSISALQTPRKVRAQVGVTSLLNMEGVDADGTRVTPDTTGAVGATQYVQWVNLSLEVFDKASGNVVLGPIYGNTLWNDLGGTCETQEDGDIVAQYDKIAGVWVLAQHAYPAGGGPPFYLCIAVSQTSDATGIWNLYSVELPNNFPDYPKLATWPDAYYVTTNEQNPSTFANLGALVCALDRIHMLAGASASPAQCFQLPVANQSLLAADLDGSNPPPAGSPNYLLNRGSNSLNLWKFHVDWQTPANTTLTGPLVIPVTPFTSGCKGSGLCVPQNGTTQLLDGIGDRLMNRVAYRHFADGHESLVASSTVNTPSNPPTGVAWYEIQNPAGTPVVFQQGTIAPDSNYRWMSSIAMDQMGDIAVGYSVSSSSMEPAIRYSGRLQSDPLNTMESENSIMEGPAYEEGSNRWGDYSGMSVDPADDCTFYYTNQYQSTVGSYNWNTRIASFKFPSCTNSPAVTLVPNGLYFGDQAVGTTGPGQTVTLNNTQTSTLSINSIVASGDYAQTNTCGSSVAAQSNCTVTVTFTPTTTGVRTGQVTISDSASGSPQVINMTGSGGSALVSLGQTSLSFKSFPQDTTATKTVKLTNAGSAPLTVSSVVASGDYSVTTTCVRSIAPAGSCIIDVSFTPTVIGTILGEVTIADNAPGAPHLINLSGVGLTALGVAPSSLTFATTSVGSNSATQKVTITNNASTSQTLSYAASGSFTAVPGGSAPCSASQPLMLNAGSSCTLSVGFSPTTAGALKGSVTVTDTASGVAYNPLLVSLTGTATGGTTAALSGSPDTLGFGNVVVGSSIGPKTITVTNKSTSPVSILGLAASGDFAVASTGTNRCVANTTIVQPGKTCALHVTVTPNQNGYLEGAVTLTDKPASGPTTQVFDLTVTGVWPISLLPGKLTFSAQSVGTTSTAQIVTVSNYSSSVVTLNTILPSGNFAVVSGSSSPCGASIPSAIGQEPGTCTFGVTFTPSVSGVIDGAVTVSHNAAGNNSPQIVSITATGQ